MEGRGDGPESHSPHSTESPPPPCPFLPSHIKASTDSLRMILWTVSTIRKSPPSFLRMLTE